MDEMPKYKPELGWAPPALNTQMEVEGKAVSFPKPKDQHLFQLLKGLSDTRLKLDKLNP